VREPAYTDLSKLVEDACDVLRPHLAQPFAFFGHSMGAVVAFEAARRLAREGTEPVALFLSGRRAPGIPDSEPSLEHLSDADFVEAIDARFGGIPDVIRDSSELMELLLPTLRADVTALVNYHYQEGDRLGSAIYAFGGIDDLTVSEQEMSVWREVTHGPFLSRMFRGGHFFIESSRSEVLAFMAAELDSLSKSSDSEVSDGS
jgi:medium-chain acyl-[acyl-carrier-protein] hydrolase